MLNRPIALKLPHGTWRRAGLAERMEREREILATLEHPNIARLYDAGLTREGQPYLAIEYVEGRNIDVFAPGTISASGNV
jgi:serine/threonine-protein kinase